MVNLMVCSYKNGKFMTGNGKLLWLIYCLYMDNLWLMVNSYPLVICYSSLLKMAIETVDLPIKNCDFP